MLAAHLPLVLASSRPLVVGTLALVALAAGTVALWAHRPDGTEPPAGPAEPTPRRRLARLTWLVGGGAAGLTVLLAAALGITTRGHAQGRATPASSPPSPSSSPSAPSFSGAQPSEPQPNPPGSDSLQAPSSPPVQAPQSDFGFGSGAS